MFELKKQIIMETIMYLVGYDSEFIETCNSGWGCGYVMVPVNHPFIVKLQAELDAGKKEADEEGLPFFNDLYPQIYEEGFDFFEEITYYKEEEVDGVTYKVFGFDTAHLNQSITRNPFSYVMKATRNLKKLIDSKV